MNSNFVMLVVLAGSFGLSAKAVDGQISATPALSAPSQHSFDLTIHYHYSVLNYVTPHTAEQFMNDPMSVGNPEHSLAELLLAARAGNYSLWLSKWDPLSQRRLTEDLSQKAVSREQYLGARTEAIKGAQVVREAFRAPYVFFVLRSAGGSDFAFAFKPSDKGWMATTEVDWEAQELANSNL